jgi:hypothetical protein
MHEADALIASVCDIEIALRIEADARGTIQLDAFGDATIPAQAPFARARDHLDRPSLQIYGGPMLFAYCPLISPDLGLPGLQVLKIWRGRRDSNPRPLP